MNHNNVSSNAESLRKQLKDLEARKPEVDNKVQAAYRTVETIGQDVSQLEAELSDAEKVAADLERKAREARYESHLLLEPWPEFKIQWGWYKSTGSLDFSSVSLCHWCSQNSLAQTISNCQILLSFSYLSVLVVPIWPHFSKHNFLEQPWGDEACCAHKPTWCMKRLCGSSSKDEHSFWCNSSGQELIVVWESKSLSGCWFYLANWNYGDERAIAFWSIVDGKFSPFSAHSMRTGRRQTRRSLSSRRPSTEGPPSSLTMRARRTTQQTW